MADGCQSVDSLILDVARHAAGYGMFLSPAVEFDLNLAQYDLNLACGGPKSGPNLAPT